MRGKTKEVSITFCVLSSPLVSWSARCVKASVNFKSVTLKLEIMTLAISEKSSKNNAAQLRDIASAVH